MSYVLRRVLINRVVNIFIIQACSYVELYQHVLTE